jgi:hypothetical protein
MNEIKEKIYSSLAAMEAENKNKISSLRKRALLTDYEHLARESNCGKVWTDALRAALSENEIVEIPTGREPYYIDDTVVIPSNRRIEAWRAVLCLTPECRVLMFRNEHTKDGTKAPIDSTERDCNISIFGGCFAESRAGRAGYGASGRYSEKEEFFGVSTCMLFNNIENLTLKNVTFKGTSGFAVQVGDIKNAVFENIWFKDCFADGLHINGGSENIVARHIYGEVGDDLVALNAYDWQNSSVNFGAIKNVLCEHLNLAPLSRYKALRFEPGIYTYTDGTTVDCALENIIIKDVIGIKTFKMYLQTPPYAIGGEREKGEPGTVDNFFFENIRIDLSGPIDAFPEYVNSDTVRGAFAAFELGANVGAITFENIDFTHHGEEFPLSYLVCIGPKSIVSGGNEVFDPYVNSRAERLIFNNITVNGEKPADIRPLLREVMFVDVNGDGASSGKGEISAVVYK